ncbi:SigB/SigF/SigG family RNA polymerase sigma factor [Actinoplanes sp. NPDC049118]|uniref:SigB/SigF/SigG family RNA polymerase sigma factor n=1 Tax=Actinoplanes sp. NPDC049118 TaxID=3155769 RepID=UPI0033D36AF7
MRTASAQPTTVAATSRDEHAVELVVAYAASPVTHPARPDLRRRSIEAWTPMADRLARRYAGRGEPFEDLRQTAAVGLIKAVDRFDPRSGNDFVAYAVPTVLGEIRRHFRDRAWTVRVPRRIQELWLAISVANGVWQARFGRMPTVADLAAYLRVSDEEIIEGLEGSRAYRARSLSAPVGPEGSCELVDTLGVPERGYALAELGVDLGPAMAALTERERRVISLRFYGNHTLAQIAERIGVSPMHASRLLATSLAKLRRRLVSWEGGPAECRPAAGNVWP